MNGYPRNASRNSTGGVSMSQENTDSRSRNAPSRPNRIGRWAGAVRAPARVASRILLNVYSCWWLPVDGLDLRHGLGDGGLGRRTRDGLGKHVDDDPAVDHFAVPAIGGRRPRRELARLQHLLERLDARLDVPLRHLVEGVQVRG